MRGTIVGAGLIAANLVWGGSAVVEAQSAAERAQMKAEFLRRVDEYVALHRRLEQSLPPQVISRAPRAILAPTVALGKAMRKARPGATQGDIFTPGVAVYMRVVMVETLRREAILDMAAIVEEEHDVRTPATVNGAYPAGRAVPFIPPCLLAALPELPREVRYSFIGRDLILWDMHAGLIVDAVTGTARSGARLRWVRFLLPHVGLHLTHCRLADVLGATSRSPRRRASWPHIGSMNSPGARRWRRFCGNRSASLNVG